MCVGWKREEIDEAEQAGRLTQEDADELRESYGYPIPKRVIPAPAIFTPVEVPVEILV